ncbi:MAG: prolipoprotein diacylglyceryl transferase family protein [Desulfotomaculaceae bacterium]
MHPILWQITTAHSNIIIFVYPVFLAAAALTMVGASACLATRQGIPWKKSLPILVLMALAVLVGARLLNYYHRPDMYAADPGLLYNLQSYGFSLYGGLVLALVTGGIACLFSRVNIPRLADATAPALGVSIAIMRVGCFMAGCCFGKETDLPWGVSFPMFSLAHWAHLSKGWVTLFQSSLPTHPTQLYELLAALICGGVAYLILKRQAAPGTAFAAFFFCFSIFRYFNRYLRYEITTALPPYFYPFLYGTMCLLAAGYIIYMNYWVKRPRVTSK